MEGGGKSRWKKSKIKSRLYMTTDYSINVNKERRGAGQAGSSSSTVIAKVRVPADRKVLNSPKHREGSDWPIGWQRVEGGRKRERHRKKGEGETWVWNLPPDHTWASADEKDSRRNYYRGRKTMPGLDKDSERGDETASE